MHTRRHLLAALAGSAASPLATLSVPAWASGRPGDTVGANRLALVVLRGGLDGLGAVPAPGDPEFEPARAALAV